MVKQTGKHRRRFKIRGVATVIAVDAGTHLQDGDVAPRVPRYGGSKFRASHAYPQLTVERRLVVLLSRLGRLAC